MVHLIDTEHEQDKFVADAQKLTDEIVSAQGSMNHVSHLLNIWGVFVPSNSVRGATNLPST